MLKSFKNAWIQALRLLTAIAVGLFCFGAQGHSLALAQGGTLAACASDSALSRTVASLAVAIPAPCKPKITTDPPPFTPPLYTMVNWGAYVGDLTTDAEPFEWSVGRYMNMQSVFTGWGSINGPFPSQFGPSVRDRSKTLVVFWEQYHVTLNSIIAGNSDAYIHQFAADAQAYGGPVILAPFHEMNGNWVPWGGTVGTNTPAKVVSAWRHVHDVFGNVPNVKFAWTVNSNSVPNTLENAITAYYPGNSYTDYVAVDGFNFGTPWLSFDQIFNNALTTLKTYSKPIYILSMASAPGTLRADWITDALTVQLRKYPEVAGWVWFNVNKERDWQVNSDASSLKAFTNALPPYDIIP